MKVTCHSCGAKYAIADDKVRGRRVKVRCKSCATPIVVDGYAVDDGSEEPAAAMGGADDWSVNLSDTDQRTMSTDEIIAGWHSGLVREDAFVWKDGMDDWKPVLEVPELAGRFFERRPSAPAPAVAHAPPPWQAADNGAAPAGLGFGSPPVAAATAARPAARVSGGRAAGGDLFSNVAHAGSEEDATHAFPSSMPASQPYDDQKPTGARNENSVLFSLDALKAGFTPSAQATPGPTRPAADTGGTANLDDLMNIGGSSGSPLFGFSQNQALLHAPPPPEPPPPPPPELVAPASLSPSYAPAAPPQKSSSKLVFALLGVIALLLVVGVGAAVVVTGKSEKTEVAQTGDKKDDPDKSAATSGDKPEDESAEAKKDEAKTDEGEAKKDEGDAKKDDEEKVPVTEEDKKRFAEAQKKKEEEAKKKPDEKKEEEVAKKEPSSGVGSFNKGAAVAALSSAAAAASGCKRPGGPTGTGRAVVTFAPSGRATSANVTGGSFGGTSVGGCIASVFRRAKVPPFDGNSVTVSKSFNIAP